MTLPKPDKIWGALNKKTKPARETNMAMRDTAIVAYSEVKTVQKSDRDVWEIGAEILEDLLNKTGMEKGEIDGL
jgi:hypothetical protein